MPFVCDDDDQSNFGQCLAASPGSLVSSPVQNGPMKYNQSGHNVSNDLECGTATSAHFRRPIRRDSLLLPNATRYISPNRHPKSPEWMRRHTNVELDRSAWQYSAPMGPDITSSPSDGQSSPVYSTAAVVTDRLDAKVFAFYVKQAGPWVRREPRTEFTN